MHLGRIDQYRRRWLDPMKDLPGGFLEKRVVYYDDQIGFINITALIDGLVAQTGKRDYRRTPSFGAEQSKVLDLKSREKAGSPQYPTGNFCPLSTATVKSNLDHTSVASRFILSKRKTNAID